MRLVAAALRAPRPLRVPSLAACLLLLSAAGPAGAAEILVSAAASLSSAFTDLGGAFADASPGSSVLFNFGASGALLAQLEAGAPADILATADRATMDLAEARGLLRPRSRRVFASNRLVLIAPARTTDPAGLTGLTGLTGPGVRRVAVGKPETTPFGRYAAQALAAAGLERLLAPKLIRCETVRQALDYVARGEADAGIVFSTDALLQPAKVRVVGVLKGHESIEYHLALLRGAREPAPAAAFVAFVAGPHGREPLVRAGFLPPRP